MTSYKDRRKTPCEAAEPSLRTYFEGIVSPAVYADISVKTLRVYTFISVACNILCCAFGVEGCDGYRWQSSEQIESLQNNGEVCFVDALVYAMVL
jgi:hypothetical protein